MNNAALANLQRMEIQDLGGVTPIRGELPGEAVSLLGYEVLQKKKEQSELLQVLRELNNAPFEPCSVFNYKQHIISQTAPRLSDRVAMILGVIGIHGLLLSFGPAILGWLVSWRIGLGAAIAFVASICLAGSMLQKTEGIKAKGEWSVKPLAKCQEEVPIFALSLAVNIKKRLPGACFFVHQFFQENQLLDPFLVVKYGGEEYYIAVWNESTFEAARKI